MTNKRNCMTDKEIVAKLQLVINIIKKFPGHKDLVVLKEHPLRSDIIKSGGLHKYAELMNYPSPKNINGYWTDITSDNTIKKAIEYYGHFPTQEEVSKKYKGLSNYINTHGGINFFRRKYGYKPLQVEKGYWNDEVRISELKKVMEQIGHFPEQRELEELGRYDLMQTITRHGGLSYYRQLFGIPKKQKPSNVSFDKTVEKLRYVVDQINHFPTIQEIISLGYGDLVYSIKKTGGINKYRNIFGCKLPMVSDGHYTPKQTIEDVTCITNILGHFPKLSEIKNNPEWCRMTYGIKLNGGINNIRTIMGYPILKERNGGLSENNTEICIKDYIDKYNCFPTRKMLEKIGNTRLMNAISSTGGFNYYIKKFGFKIKKHRNGFWSYDITLKKLQEKINILGYYPSNFELEPGLVHAILKHGGNAYFRKLLGYKADYWSEMCSYFNKRGKNTEKIVLNIIKDYCVRKKIKEPILNKKFKSGKIIEFVCETDKMVGIDVVNTRNINTIKIKWLKRDYHKYLDELIIVVFSNIFNENNYNDLNKESPDNVSIISIEEFCHILEYDLDTKTEEKINKYKSCTFSKRTLVKKEKEGI